MWEWNPQRPIKLDGNNTTILSHHSYILCHLANYALCLLVCARARVVEGSEVGLGGCNFYTEYYIQATSLHELKVSKPIYT